jgi:NADH-quinone oxidoreductase subunit K
MMTVTLSHYLILAAVLFSISIAGIVINRKNIIILLMSIELMLLSVNFNFIAFSHYLDDLAGQVFVFFGIHLPRYSVGFVAGRTDRRILR